MWSERAMFTGCFRVSLVFYISLLINHEQGVQGSVEYDYYPACFLVKVVGGEMRKQQGEIQDMQLFTFDDIPEPLAFVHSQMVKDYLDTRESQAER